MRFTFCLILPSLIFAESSTLTASQPNSIFNPNNQDEEKGYVRNATIASTVSSHIQIGNSKNIGIASFLISANESANLNLVPVLLGSIKISWNLVLTGRTSAFSNQNKAINIYGWGLSYKPGGEDRKSPWNFGINSGVYKHFNNISSSSFTLSLMRKIYLRKSDVFLGISSNNVKGVNYNTDQNIDSQDFKYIFSNFIFGTTIKLKGIKILPAFNYRTDNFVVIIGLQKEF